MADGEIRMEHNQALVPDISEWCQEIQQKNLACYDENANHFIKCYY